MAGEHRAACQRGSALAGGGQRVLRNRAEGVALIFVQGLTLKLAGDTAPLAGDSVSTPRYRLQPKMKNSPGLLVAPSGAMPPPTVNSQS